MKINAITDFVLLATGTPFARAAKAQASCGGRSLFAQIKRARAKLEAIDKDIEDLKAARAYIVEDAKKHGVILPERAL